MSNALFDQLVRHQSHKSMICCRHAKGPLIALVATDTSNYPFVRQIGLKTLIVLHLNLGKKDYSTEPDLQAAATRADRAKGHDQARQSLLEQQQRERAAKRRKLNESGQQVSKIDFVASSGEERLESESMTSEIPNFQVQEPPEKEATTQTEGPEQNEAGSQTEEFDYMFMPAGYQAPDQEYFDFDAKVRFYTGLPSYEVLMVFFEHVSLHVSRQTQNLSRFQEFVMVLIKLRLNVPLQDLAYRFVEGRDWKF